MNTSVNMS